MKIYRGGSLVEAPSNRLETGIVFEHATVEAAWGELTNHPQVGVIFLDERGPDHIQDYYFWLQIETTRQVLRVQPGRPSLSANSELGQRHVTVAQFFEEEVYGESELQAHGMLEDRQISALGEG